jgi:peptidoglycan/LPS O-acetylase OafA/YrhL
VSQGRGETLDNVDNLTAESRNLDMLRALAVACVFVAHLTLSLISRPYPQWPDKWIAPLYEMGRIGVQIFFVHTSLVLLLSLQRQKPPNLFLNFYVRRLFRIYPLSLTCIIITLLFRIPYLPRDAFFPPEWTAVLSDLLLIQNLTHTKEFIFPLWTLPLEVQMYAALPVIYVLLSRFGSAPFVLMMWAATFAAARVWPFFFFVPYFMGGVFGYQVSREKTFRAPGIFWPMALVWCCLYKDGSVITSPRSSTLTTSCAWSLEAWLLTSAILGRHG